MSELIGVISPDGDDLSSVPTHVLEEVSELQRSHGLDQMQPHQEVVSLMDDAFMYTYRCPVSGVIHIFRDSYEGSVSPPSKVALNLKRLWAAYWRRRWRVFFALALASAIARAALYE